MTAPPDRKEQSALLAESANPAKLREQRLGPPVVGGRCEQLFRLITDERARVRPHILDVVLIEPALHLGNRMTMLLRMLILIAQPRLASRWIILAIAQYRIEWDQPVSRQASDQAAEPKRNARQHIVEPK